MCDCISLPLVQYIACQKCDNGNNSCTAVGCCEGATPVCRPEHSGGL